MKVTAVLTVRNEGAFLLEWLAHHRACGLSDFLVFSNDCDDGTDAMLDRLQAIGWLTHLPNPRPYRGGPQWTALKRADRHPLVLNADWLITLDMDEFINIHVGNRTIPALLAALPNATAIPLTWRVFGNAGVVALTDAPVTETFTRAAPAILYWPWRAQLFKTLFRNDGSYRKMGIHRPRKLDPDRLPAPRWFDGSGQELPALFHRQRLFSDPGRDSIRLAQMNHYALGTAEGFIVKCDRGGGSRTSTVGADYWTDFNQCDAEDTSILDLPSRDLRAGLHADPVLGQLHRQAVAWRQHKLRALLSEDRWRGLFDLVRQMPPTRVPSWAEAIAHMRREQESRGL